jgi:hypothetical protein
MLLDLIVSSDKANGGTITIQFNDGTYQIALAVFQVTDAPISLAMTFGGRWQGWEDSWLELVTATGSVAPTVTVSCGYLKIPQINTLPYDEWDSLR